MKNFKLYRIKRYKKIGLISKIFAILTGIFAILIFTVGQSDIFALDEYVIDDVKTGSGASGETIIGDTKETIELFTGLENEQGNTGIILQEILKEEVGDGTSILKSFSDKEENFDNDFENFENISELEEKDKQAILEEEKEQDQRDIIPNKSILGLNSLRGLGSSQITVTGDTPDDGILRNKSYFTAQYHVNEPNLSGLMCILNDTEISLYDDSLVLMYNFDNIEELGESATLVKDLSKYSNNLTINGATWTDIGKWGGAYNFDGKDDYATLDSSELKSIFGTGTYFTVSAWAKPTSWVDYSMIIGQTNGSYYGNTTFGIRVASNGFHCILGRHTSSNTATNLTNLVYKPNIGARHHIMCVVNGNTMTMYVDGVNRTSASLSSMGVRSTITNPIYIGKQANYKTFPGEIDEIRVYNRVFSDNEIQTLYNSNLAKINTDEWSVLVTPNSLTDGLYTYKLGVIDTGLNIGYSEERTINIDITPPNLTLSSDGSGICSRISPTYTVSGVFSELVTDFDESDLVVVNGVIQNFEELSDTGFIFEVVSDNTGNNTVTVNVPVDSFFDLAGNTNTSNTLSWNYDLVGPTGSIQIDYNGNEISASGTTLNLTLSAEDIGCNGVVEKMQFSCDEINWTSWEDYATTKIFALEDNIAYGCTIEAGEKIIYVRYKDGFGNISDDLSDMIIYDTGNPEITLSYGDGESCIGPFVYVTGTFSEDVTGVDMSDIDVINGCISEFRKISGDIAVWAIKSAATGCDTYVHESMDGDINTLTICDPNNGKKCVTMMDRNLGATSNDRTSTGSYGYHYQWGNIHGFASNFVNGSGKFPGGETTATATFKTASSYGPGNRYNVGTFIYGGINDWANPANNNLWGGSSDTQSNNWGYNLTNNVTTNVIKKQGPCPTGYHMPSVGEWNKVLSYFSQEKILTFDVQTGLYKYTLNGLGTEFAINFKIPFAGNRAYNTSKISGIDTYSYFWTTSQLSPLALASYVGLNSLGSKTYSRAYGFSMRCFRDYPLTFPVGDGGATGIVQVSMTESKFTDIAGNLNTSGSNTVTWTFDAIGPIGSIDVKYNGNDELSTGETVVLTLNAEDVGCNGVVEKMQFSCNGTYWTTPEAYATTKDFSLGSYTSYGCNTINGEKIIYVRYIDGLGNISEIYSDSIMLNVSPKVEINSSSSGLCVGGTTYVTGTLNKTVKLLDNSDLIVSGGCIKHFRKISDTKFEWIVSNDCNVHLKGIDGVDTISVCDPNDSTKCVTMMDKNLGATTNNTASTGSYGKHYQWGNNYGFVSNFSNGSSTFPGGGSAYNGNKNASGYGPGNRYSDTNFVINKNDWSTVRNDNLWGGSGDSIDNNWGYDIENNVAINASNRKGPCPVGYHVPSAGEWSKLLEYWADKEGVTLNSSNSLKSITLTGIGDIFINDFNISKAGQRANTAKTDGIGSYARLWTSSPYGTSGYRVVHGVDSISTANSYMRSYAKSIRCFKDTPLSFSSDENTWYESYGTIEVSIPENSFTDLVGNLNESGSNTITWTFDAEGPTGSIDVKYNGNDDLATGETVTLTLRASDIGCNGTVEKMQFSCDGINWSPSEDFIMTKEFSFWDYTGYGCNALNGNKTIYVRYIDGLGNTSESYSDSIMLNVSPTVELTSDINSCSSSILYRIVGSFNKVVTGLDATDIIVTGGCATEIHQESGTQSSWLISLISCDSYKRIHEVMDGDINTLTICNPNKRGKCITMMDRNLGATSNNISSTGSYGYHYERGNNHGFQSCYKANCSSFPGGETTSTTLVNTNGYGPGNWYSGSVFRYKKGSNVTLLDWSSPSNNNLRGGSGDSADNNYGYDIENNVALNVTGRQGPCPDGYHVPSIGEWENLIRYWVSNYTGEGYVGVLSGTAPAQIGFSNSVGVPQFRKDFKIPLAGYRAVYNRYITEYGSAILLWSSSPGSTNGWTYDVSIRSNGLSVYDLSERAYGRSLRCFKDHPFIFDIETYTGTMEITLPKNSFTDLAGNLNESGSNIIQLSYDFAGPTGTIDINYNGNDELATGEIVNLILGASDLGCNSIVSGMQFSCNGTSRSPVEDYVTSKDFNFWDYTGYGCNTLNGEKTIYVRYVDGLGNIGESFSDSIMLHVSPEVELSSDGSGLCTPGDTYIYITGTFNKGVIVDGGTLAITSGCIRSFDQISDTQAVWVISTNDCFVHEEMVGDINTISVCDINDSTKCVTMMDRNLGATSNDRNSTGSYGYHYQWGNNHGFASCATNYCSTFPGGETTYKDNTISTSSYGPGRRYSGYIYRYFSYRYTRTNARKDWSDPGNDNLRGGSGDSINNNWGFNTGTNMVINATNRQGPCPTGYHIPSAGEWGMLLTYRAGNYTGLLGNSLDLSISQNLPRLGASNYSTNQFVKSLKIPYATFRNGIYDDYRVDYHGSAYLWSSSPSPNSDNSRYLAITKNNNYSSAENYVSAYGNRYRIYGQSIRCFKNSPLSFEYTQEGDIGTGFNGIIEVNIPENTFTDRAGNINESGSNTISRDIDRVGPTGTIDVKYNGDDVNASGSMLTLTLHAEDVGCNGTVSRMQFSCNGTGRTTKYNYATSYDLNISTYNSYGCNTVDGEKTIYVRYIDNFGNIGEVTSDSITLNIPPEVSISVNSGYSWTSGYSCKGPSATVSGTFTEPVTGVDPIDLVVTGGCARLIGTSDTTASWSIRKSTENCDEYIYEEMDGNINTLTVCNPDDGRECITIMDRNLGATNNDISSTGSFGYHYQRGNNHGFEPCYENLCSVFPGGETTGILNNRIDATGYGPGNFYDNNIFIRVNGSPYDWSNPSNNNLRGGSGDSADNNYGYDIENNVALNVTGRQGPCPEGYHVPSAGEWGMLIKYWTSNYTGKRNKSISLNDEPLYNFLYETIAGTRFKEDFKISFDGYRDYNSYKISYSDVAQLRSSSPYENNSNTTLVLYVSPSYRVASNGSSNRVTARPIRCFRNSALNTHTVENTNFANSTGIIEVSIPSNSFTDLAGNENISGSNTVTWEYDAAGPTGTIDVKYGGNDEYATNDYFYITLNAEDIGCNGTVSGMQFSCDGITRCSSENYTSTKRFYLSNYTNCGCDQDDGEKTIYVRYIDNLGNIGEPVSDSIELDTVNPSIEEIYTDSGNICRNTLTGQYIVTGIFSETVTGAYLSTINGVVSDFEYVSGGSVVQWTVEITDDYPIIERMDGDINTLTICNYPLLEDDKELIENDKEPIDDDKKSLEKGSKSSEDIQCITMMDRNLGATQAGVGCKIGDYLCENTDYSNCYIADEKKGIVCESEPLDLRGLNNSDTSCDNNTMQKIFNECIKTRSGSYGHHYQRGNNHGFASCTDGNGCSTFPGGESSLSGESDFCSENIIADDGGLIDIALKGVNKGGAKSAPQIDVRDYGPGNWYSGGVFIYGFGDWADPSNDNLRGGENDNYDDGSSAIEKKGTKSTKDGDEVDRQGPCPEGYHVPTASEWETVFAYYKEWEGEMYPSSNTKSSEAFNTYWYDSYGLRDAFQKALKIPYAGYRDSCTSSVYGIGRNGYYWSSTPYQGSDSARALIFGIDVSLHIDTARTLAKSNNSKSISDNNVFGGVYQNPRSLADSVRCFRDTGFTYEELEDYYTYTGNNKRTKVWVNNYGYRDLAGNYGQNGSNRIYFDYDAEGPMGIIDIKYNGNDNYASGTTLNLSLAAVDLGCSSVDKMQFSCNGTNWTPLENYSGTKIFALGDYTNYGCTTSDGEKTIYVRYIDALGNTGEVHSDSIILDMTSPEVEILSNGSGMCTRLSGARYTVTGLFSEPIIGLGRLNLFVTGGGALNFKKISSTGAVWTVKPGTVDDGYIHEMLDDDNIITLTICDPEDDTKCVTMMDRNLGATEAGTGCNIYDYYCSAGRENEGFDNYENCIDICTENRGDPIGECEYYCTPEYKGYETVEECQNNMADDFYDCINTNSGTYGYHYQWGNNHGFAPCIDIKSCSTFPGGESSVGSDGEGLSIDKKGNTKDGEGPQIDTSGYGPGNWYSGGVFIYGFEDWSDPSNDNLRGGSGDSVENNRGFDTGTNTAINATGRQGPCPDGYHVPSAGERSKLLEYRALNYTGQEDYSGEDGVGLRENEYNLLKYFGRDMLIFEPKSKILGIRDTDYIIKFKEDFKLSSAGGRSFFNASIDGIGLPGGVFWSSSPSPDDTLAYAFGYMDGFIGGETGPRATGYPLRCFRNSAMTLPQEELTGGYGTVTMSIPESSFTDLAGNSNVSGSNTISRGWDEIGPTGDIQVHYNGNTTHASGTTLNLVLNANDVGCSTVEQVQFSCDGENRSPAETYNSTKDFSLGSYTDYGCTTSDGEKIIYVKYIDALENTGEDIYSGSIIVDTVPPEATLISDGSGSCDISKTYTVTGVFSEVLTGLKPSDLTVTNGTIQNFTKVSDTVAVWKVKGDTAHGAVSVSILANNIFDLAGNGNTIASNTITRNVDETGPTGSIDIKYNGNDIYATGTTLNLILDATDVGCNNIVDKMQFSCDGENRSPAEEYSTAKNFVLGNYTNYGCSTINGEKIIYVRYIDGFGNTGGVYNDSIVLDTVVPSVELSSDGSGTCSISTTYTVTGVFSESVTGIDSSILTVINGTVQNFQMVSGNVGVWTVISSATTGAKTVSVRIETGVFTDLAGNTNIIGSNTITWNYDNQGPNFILDDVETPECTTGTMIISGITQVGCASGHTNPYSWDAGNTWATTDTDTAYSGGIGTKTITVQVRDALGNYTEKTVVYIWTDTAPTVNNFSVDAVGTGKTVNWKELGNARDGACGSGNVSAVLKTDSSVGHCTIDGNDISFVANEGASGSDTCVILVTDDENSTGEFTITWNNIFRPIPKITFTGINPVDGIEINQNRFTTKMNISNIDNIKDFKYQYNNSEYDLMSGLVLMYNFDNIESLGESSTLVKDLSNNGNDGIVNGATRTSNGKYRGAYSFDGTNDYVSALQTGELSQIFGPTGTVFTLSAWAKPTLYKNWSVLLGNTNGGYYSDTTAAIWVSSQGFQCVFGAGVPNNPGGAVTYKTYGPELNQRHHIVCVADGTKMNMYVDGIIRGTYNLSLVTYPRTGNTNPVYVGKRSGSGVFSGEIDEVRIYNRALSQDEVQFLYKSNLSKINPDTWEFETVNTCLTASGIYNYTGIVKSFVDTSASTGRLLTTNISLVTVSGTGHDFGTHKVNGTGYILSGTMGKLTVTDKLGNSGWLVYFASSESLVGSATQKKISTENLKFKANSLIYSGMYEGYTNTYVSLGSGISMTEFKTAYSSGCTVGQDECTGNSAKILEYIKRNDDPQDFMCGEVGTYSDDTQIQLEVPARQIGDEYKGILWVTLQQN